MSARGQHWGRVFRRDLRVWDHSALCAAVERAERVVPCLCFDDHLLHGMHPGAHPVHA
jgi:deoxyribodipyrimidine photolyase